LYDTAVAANLMMSQVSYTRGNMYKLQKMYVCHAQPYGRMKVRSYVHKAGRSQLSSEWRHNKNDVIMRTPVVRDVIMRMTSQWRTYVRMETLPHLVYKNGACLILAY